MNDSRQGAFLNACVAQVPVWFDRFVRDMEAAMSSRSPASSLPTKTARAVSLGGIRAALQALHTDRPGAIRRVQEQTVANFQSAMNPDARADDSPGRSGAGELALMDDSGVEENMLLLRAVEAVRESQEQVLSALHLRLARLRGDVSPSRHATPMDAATLVRIVWEAVSASGGVGLSSESRAALLSHLPLPLANALGDALQHALDTLKELGVEAAAFKPRAAANVRPSGRPAAAAFDVSRPGALAELGGRLAAGRTGLRPIGTVATAAAPRGVASRPSAAEMLASIDASLLDAFPMLASPEARLAEPLGRQCAVLDQAVPDPQLCELLQVLTRLMHAIVHDPLLPSPVAAALARLRLPMLRLVLRDREVLNNHTHASWSLMQAISNHTLGFSDPNDHRLEALAMGIDAILEQVEAQPDIRAGTFSDAQRDLNRLFVADLDAERSELDAVLRELERKERLNAEEEHVRLGIESDLARPGLPPLGARLEEFFLGPWVNAVARSRLDIGEHAPSTRSLEALVGDLRESLVPRRSAADRNAVAQLVPVLVQRVRRGFALAAVPMVEQNDVLAELMALHSQALHGRRDADDGGLAQSYQTGPGELVKRMLEEYSESQFGAGDGDHGADAFGLSNLPTVPQALMDEFDDAAQAGRGAGASLLRSLTPGTWCRVVVRGAWRVARLVWVGPKGRHFLFSDDEPGLTHAFTRVALEHMAQARLALLLEERPLLERAAEELITRPGD